MSTKCIVLGQEEKKELEKIEFVKALNRSFMISNASTKPSDWDNIELITKNYTYKKEDVMFAYNECRRNGCLYLGHWNDGVV